MVENLLERGISLSVDGSEHINEANSAYITPKIWLEIKNNIYQAARRRAGEDGIHTVNAADFLDLKEAAKKCCSKCLIARGKSKAISCTKMTGSKDSFTPALAESKVGMLNESGWKQKLAVEGARCYFYFT